MGTDRSKDSRGHAEHATELVDGFEWRARRPIIEARCPISRRLLRLLRARPGGSGGSDPFADRLCQLACGCRVAARNAQQCVEELWCSRVRIDPPGLVSKLHRYA